MGDLVPTNDSEYTENRRTFNPGPAVLKLSQPDGEVFITVSDKVTQPTAFVRTKAKSGKAYKAVQNVDYDQRGQQLMIRVPKSKENSGGAVFIGSGGGSMVITGGVGGKVIINGRDVTAELNKDDPGVQTFITLPKGSWVELDTQSADATVDGFVENLRYHGASGDLRASEVQDLTVDATSGDVHVRKVTGTLDAAMTSGSLKLSEYAGSSAKVRLSSGAANISASPKSSGSFDISVTSGSAVVYGARHLNVTQKVSTGFLRVN